MSNNINIFYPNLSPHLKPYEQRKLKKKNL